MPFLLLSVVLVAAVVFLLTGAQALVAQDAFRLSALSTRATEIRLENDLLRLRVAELSTPDRIAAAGRRSGLVPAGQVEVLGGGR
jgi:cell division protein FtsL